MSVDAESQHNRVCSLSFVVVTIALSSDVFLIAGSIRSS